MRRVLRIVVMALVAAAGIVAGAAGALLLGPKALPPPIAALLAPKPEHPPFMRCRSMGDVEANSLPHQLHVVDLSAIYRGKDFAPITGFILSHVDQRVVLGYLFPDGCIGDPIVVAWEAP